MLATHEGRQITREVLRRIGDIFQGSHPLHWAKGSYGISEVHINSLGENACPFDRRRENGIDGDTSLADLLGQDLY